MDAARSNVLLLYSDMYVFLLHFLEPQQFISAAGALIVEEAGGIVTDADGRALSLDRKCSVVARNAVVRPL